MTSDSSCIYVLPEGGYSAKHDGSLRDIWRHFTTRGHSGPVQCVDASHHADIIASGGMDYTTRIWKYDPRYDAYDLIALVAHEVSHEELSRPTVTTSGRRSTLKFWQSGIPAWDGSALQGITAVACVWSLAASEVAGRIGPVISGTAHGHVSVLCLSAALGHGLGVTPLPGLHQGAIHDICAQPTYPDDSATGKTFVVMTASADGTAALLRMECQETDNPNFSTHRHVDRTPFFDVMFCGGGGRAARRAAREEYAKHPDEHQAAAHHKGMHQDEAQTCLQCDRVTRLARCEHDTAVLSVRHLGDNRQKDRAMFATLTAEAAHLWNFQGERLITLRICTEQGTKCFSRKSCVAETYQVSVRQHESMASVNKRRGSLLFVAGEGQVAAWSLKQGRVGAWDPNQGIMQYSLDAWAKKLEEAQAQDLGDEGDVASIEPVCVYQRCGGMLEVDQSGVSASWALQIQTDGTTADMWGLDLASPDCFALEPDCPANLLICPGKERVQLHLSHASKVLDMKVFEDVDGAALAAACAGGNIVLWDLAGDNSGQQYAEMRSLEPWEFLLPLAILFVTVAQMFSFAFGPSIRWEKEVRKSFDIVYEITMLDFKLALTADREKIFWPEMCVVIFWITLFDLCAIFGAPQLMDSAVRNAQEAGWRDFTIRLIKGWRDVTYLTMRLSSTIFVVPLIQSCCQAVDCVRLEGVPWDRAFGNPNNEIYLAVAPQIMCWRGDHLRLFIAMFLTVPLFVFFVIPYAVVGGDAAYVRRAMIYEYRVWEADNAWRRAAARRSTNLHMAFMSRIPEEAFRTLFTEVLAKIFLPMVTTWNTSRPLFQMVMVMLTCFALWLSSLLHAPYVERKFSVVVQDLKFLPVCSASCGILTVALKGSMPYLPVIILGAACGSVLVLTVVKTSCLVARRPSVRKYKDRCSSLAALSEDALEAEEAARGNTVRFDDIRGARAASRSGSSRKAKPSSYGSLLQSRSSSLASEEQLETGQPLAEAFAAACNGNNQVDDAPSELHKADTQKKDKKHVGFAAEEQGSRDLTPVLIASDGRPRKKKVARNRVSTRSGQSKLSAK